MHFNLSNFNLNWKLFFIVLVVSFCGQMAGSFFSKLFIELSNKQAFLVGLSMNSKGAVELVIAFVALEVGILTKDLYFALVATALVSTILFQAIAFRISIKEPRIMK
jgi:Kef-type K+ transport system membrane component KefB